MGGNECFSEVLLVLLFGHFLGLVVLSTSTCDVLKAFVLLISWRRHLLVFLSGSKQVFGIVDLVLDWFFFLLSVFFS